MAAKNAGCKVRLRSFPELMEGARQLQSAIAPEETLIVFESRQAQHVDTDGRAHPSEDDLWPTDLGGSIAHWQGDTLVINTIAPNSSEPMVPGARASLLSEQAHFTERWRMVDRETLKDRMTIVDPVARARPWIMKRQFNRLTRPQRMLSYDCTQNERNPVVDGRIAVTPPQEQPKS